MKFSSVVLSCPLCPWETNSRAGQPFTGLIFINIIYSFCYLANIYKNSVVIALVTSRKFHSGSELKFIGIKVTVYTVIIQSVKTNCKTKSKVPVLKRDI